MFKSIQWTLQLWHASLLALVLVGFGMASYYGIQRTRFQQVDSELERNVQLLAASYAQPPMRPGDDGGRGGGGGRRGGFRGGPPQDWMEDPGADFNPTQRGGGGGRGGRDGSGDRFQGGRRGPPRVPDIVIPPALSRLVGEAGEPGVLYYVIWGFDGEIIKTSVASGGDLPSIPLEPQWMGPTPPEPPRFRQVGDFREAFVYGPFGTRVLVGRSVVHEKAEMRRLAWLLSGIGAGVMAMGLLGGWLVSLRAVRPIHAIARTAQEISATNLSRRIGEAETHSELGTLATVLNDMFARLDSAFQQQVRFTADASHELRTPLAVIHTHAQLALSKDRSAEEYKQTIATCLRASTRMKGLVDSLLLLAGADAGRLSISRQRMDLAAVVEDCVVMVSPLAGERNVTVESDLSSTMVDADPTRISQVAINLLSNAIRYNREGGSVKVTVRPEGSEAILSVTDNGPGIPAEHQAHIFERFYRVDKARSREAGGSGLGLAICKSVIDAHGGKISFQSEEGKGSTFTIRLPLSTPETSSGATPFPPLPV